MEDDPTSKIRALRSKLGSAYQAAEILEQGLHSASRIENGEYKGRDKRVPRYDSIIQSKIIKEVKDAMLGRKNQ